MKRANQPTPKIVQETDAVAALFDFTDVQTNLRIDGTDDQPLVNTLIGAVTKKIESYLGIKLLTQVWSVYFDYFPFSPREDKWWDGVRDGALSELYSPERFLELPFGPCQTVSQFYTFDNADATYSFDSTNYNVDTIGSQAKIALRIGCVWPATVLRPINGIKIKGTYGYGSLNSQVPAPIVQAARHMVTTLYENRGDITFDQPFSPMAQMLLEPYRRMRV
jgi:hypothetical protein